MSAVQGGRGLPLISSIKGRLAALAVVSTLLLGVGGWYTQDVIARQIARDTRALGGQERLRGRTDALEQAVQTLEFQLYHAALSLEATRQSAVTRQLDVVEQEGQRLIAAAAQVGAPFGRAVADLRPLLPRLHEQVDGLLRLMGDAELRYPAMPYMVERLSPDNEAFLGAVTVALDEGRRMLAEGEGPGGVVAQAEVIDLFQELRFARTQQTQLFRMFVANRSGAFGQPLEAMRRTEGGVELYAQRTDELLARLQALAEAGRLGLEQRAALEVIAGAQQRYAQNLTVVMDIYRSDRWRSDLAKLRDETRPLFDRLWGAIGEFKRGVERQTAEGLRDAEESTRGLSWLIGLFGSAIALFLLTVIVTFEFGLRRPLVLVATAMEEAAHGRRTTRVPTPTIREVRRLVETFEYMQGQVRTRQARLEESERRFRALVDNAVDSLLVFDRRGRIVDANRHAEEAFGYHREELLTLNLADVAESCSEGGVEEIWRKVTRDGAGTCEGVCRRRDGSTYPAETRVGPVEWEGGRVMLALVRDVGERKQLEGQLLQSEKLASIGQLAAGVAHEINNPVGYVHSNLTTLRRYTDELFGLLDRYQRLETALPADAEGLAELRRYREEIDAAYLREDIPKLVEESLEGAQRVKGIVQDLRDFSRSDSGEWEVTDLHRHLDGTLNIAHNETKYKAEVIKEYGEIPPVRCLPSQISQVFLNLLVNAAHAIEAQGTITVRTGAEGGRVWVEVEDSGRGIPPEDLGRIFDPFFTTKPVGSGTGLGLALSYGIVQRHRGEIEVASEVGKGSRFRVWLPVGS
ncbi:ATP-binding protein [Endothiovibrio diazotrophicus]